MSLSWWPQPAARSEFFAPAMIVGGAKSSQDLGQVLREHLGVTGGTVFLAVDDAVFATGSVEPIIQRLHEDGFEVVVRGGFGVEPTAGVVDAAANEAREEDVQVVIGLGGGSVLDSSKLIALLLRNDGGVSDWSGHLPPATAVAPLVLIPTTVGTGSETTTVAMVTVDGVKRITVCASFVPQVAVLDPELVATLPPSVIAATGMDALAHAVEALMSSKASMLSAHASFHAIELLVDNLEAAYAGDSDALARTLWASHLGGQALNAGVVLGHSLAYTFAHAVPMPHGVSCALALPYCMAYNQNLDPGLSRSLARALTKGRSESLRAAADEVQQLARRMKLPTTLNEAKIASDQVPEMAAYCAANYQRPTNPEAMDEPRLRQLFASVETGDLDRAFAVTATVISK